MKIIFDSEDEKETFLMGISNSDYVCPSDFGLEDKDVLLGECRPGIKWYCLKCWRDCGLEMEVRDE